MQLTTLLGPVTIPDIVTAFDDRRLAHFSRIGDERLASMFGWDDFVTILNMYRLQSSDLRVFKNGKKLPPSWLNGSSIGIDVDRRAFSALARQGITLILNHVERRSPAMHAVWREAQAAFGHPLSLAYLANFGPGYGLEPHFDKVDLVIVQTAGVKDWHILGETADIPAVVESNRPASEVVTKHFSMQAGDVLMVPHGLGHRCFVQEASLQLGILIDRPHSMNYVEWLMKKAEKLPQYRRPAPFDRKNPAALIRYEAEVEQILQELMKTFTLTAFLTEQTRRITSDVTVADLPDTVEKR